MQVVELKANAMQPPCCFALLAIHSWFDGKKDLKYLPGHDASQLFFISHSFQLDVQGSTPCPRIDT